MTAGLRILLVHDGGGGGAEGYVRDLAALLEARGHVVDLQMPIDPAGPATLLSRYWSPRAAADTARRIREFRPDLVHAHNLLRRLSPAPLVAAARLGVPAVWTLHDPQILCPKTWLVDRSGRECASGMGGRCFATACLPAARWPVYAKLALARRLVAGRVAAAAAPSEFLASRLRGAGLPSPGVPVTALRPPVNPADWTGDHAVGAGNRGMTVVYAGRLAPEKGVDVLLEAWARVQARFPAAELLVAGEGPSRNGLQARAARELPAGRVRFLGQRSRTELAGLYARAAAVAVPSLWTEAWGQVGPEAMACATPVVASRTGGIPEWCRDGDTGLLVPPGDAAALAAALERLLAEPAAARRMGRAGRELVLQELTPAAHLRAVETWYGSVLRERRPAGPAITPRATVSAGEVLP